MAESGIIQKAGYFVADSARNEGATYADFRAVRITTETVRLSDGKPDLIDRKTSLGYGVRVLAEGAWGFAATPDFSEKTVGETLREAVAIARASARLSTGAVRLAPARALQAEYHTPFEDDPFAVPLSAKIDYLRAVDSRLRETPGITGTETFMDFRREEKWFYSSEGAEIVQTILHSGGGFSAAARKSRREFGARSFPTSGGQHAAGGYEIIENMGMQAACREIAEQAVALLTAPVLPERTTDLILGGDLVSLQLHESIGHPLELDRVLGSERNFSGTSFATPDLLGNLKYAADIVTVTSDPSAIGGLGTYGFDDEGVRARAEPLVKDGILVNYLSSRESAAHVQKASTGAMRAETWGDLPLVRMTNINLTPREGTLEELIADTEDGVLIETPANWSIDDRREDFQLGGEIAWDIKGGKRGQMYKNAVYSGSTVTFWNACDWICGLSEYRIWGTPNCGKGQPGQNMRTGQGASPARFRGVKVGQPS